MVTIDRAVPVLRVADVSRTIDWYREVLNFSADPFPAKPPYVFAILAQGGTEIMVRRTAEVRRDPADKGWDVYLRLRGGRLRDVYADLRRRVPVVRELQKMPYGLVEFDVRDPDGYVLCLSELLRDTTGIPEATD